MKRETKIVLENESSLSTGFTAATAGLYYATKVRMAVPVHNASVRHTQYGIREDDGAMKAMFLVYDPRTRRGLIHGDECGTLFGKPVFLDDTLKARLLIVESEPIPADKL